MWNPFRSGGFERKLLIFFLVLSVTPTLLIAIFGARYFAGYLERLSNVALRESFRNSMEIARHLSTKLEHDAATASLHLADSFGRRSRSLTLKDFLRGVVEREDADFAAVYSQEDDAWHLEASYPDDPDRIDAKIPLDRAPSGTAPDKIILSDSDVIASATMHRDGRLLVSGFLLESGMMDMMRKTGEDYSRYSSVSLYVDILRNYSIIVISALVVIMAVSSAVASRVLAKRISYPIQELANATDRIASGDLEHRVNVTAKDEIRSLISSFNNMTQELQENKKNLIAMAKREAQVARDFEIARQVQQNLFPDMLPSQPGCDFAATCRPARAVGGDYYDVFEVSPGTVLFAQGDVAGKGLGASLVMASVHAIVRSWAATHQRDPSKLVQELNVYLKSSSAPETFVTLFLGLLDCSTGTVWYVNCGHPPALWIRSSGRDVADLTHGGPLLGILDGDSYDADEVSMSKGDTIVLVSDGVTEAVNIDGEMFGRRRLVETVTGDPDLTSTQRMEKLLDEVTRFSEGCEQADDISILVLRKRE
jgi:serine phosphatase RsbU (regulator of sigma subunit)